MKRSMVRSILTMYSGGVSWTDSLTHRTRRLLSSDMEVFLSELNFRNGFIVLTILLKAKPRLRKSGVIAKLKRAISNIYSSWIIERMFQKELSQYLPDLWGAYKKNGIHVTGWICYSGGYISFCALKELPRGIGSGF